ncbi:unnamed protein product [Chilo suppressalis]|uniref:BRWD/PHIP N-terminal domain-containing protein n=1 Tax=Chilo suppressalis TaxID=168631 RepID=A0ABN8B3P8_CHISP|nr:hypothetical protein evm_012257 [Chilo suppressalis]CAH0403786.1 unnamed protein product [Chilo suppressalis]
MDEQNEAFRVIPELYFLIAKFLSGGPLKETAKTLLKELRSVEVLPRRLDWEGNEHTQSYEELPWLRVLRLTRAFELRPAVCESALRLARTAALAPTVPQTPAITPSPVNGEHLPAPSSPEAAQQDVASKIAARLSLLSESLNKTSCGAGAGRAVMSPRLLTSLQLQRRTMGHLYAARELGGAVLGSGAGPSCGAGAGRAVILQLQRRTLGHLSAVYCLVFDCTGRYVVTVSVKVWSAVDGRLLSTLRGAGAEITDVCVSSDGALLAAGSYPHYTTLYPHSLYFTTTTLNTVTTTTLNSDSCAFGEYPHYTTLYPEYLHCTIPVLIILQQNHTEYTYYNHAE